MAEQITVAGKPVRVTNPVVRWTFGKDGSRAIFRDDEKVLAGKYAFDPKTSAAAVNLDAGPTGGPACLAIYKIEGETLTLNVGWQKAGRPTEFASHDGFPVYALRVQADQAKRLMSSSCMLPCCSPLSHSAGTRPQGPAEEDDRHHGRLGRRESGQRRPASEVQCRASLFVLRRRQMDNDQRQGEGQDETDARVHS